MPPRKRAASNDDKAKELARLRELRHIQAEAEKEEKGLKADLVPFIEEVGSFPYIDENGHKVMAYYSDSDMTVLDIDELQAAIDRGEVSETVLELVAPRKMDGEALKQALNAGRIPKKVAQRCVTIEKARPTVRFKDEEEARDE